MHADGEPERLPVWLDAIRSGALPGGWAADDGVGLLFEDDALVRAVSSRPGAGAERCDAVAGELVRRRLVPDLLGAGAHGAHEVADDIREMRAVQRLRDEFGPGV